MLNEIFGNVELSEAEMQTLIWLAGWAENTVENVVSAIRKVMTADAKRRELPPRRAKAAFDGRNGCRKCFCVTFGESNKAYAPYPALNTTRTGRKESY